MTKLSKKDTTLWSSGLKVAVPEIYLSAGLEEFFKVMQENIENPCDEFSVLLKGDWDTQFEGFYVSKDYYIPIQEVTGTSVDYYFTFEDKKERDDMADILKDQGLTIITGKTNDDMFYVGENIYKLRKKGYNVVAHSHPFSTGGTNFSWADEEYINSHFPCSLLLDKHSEVSKACILMPTTQRGLKTRIIVEEITRLVSKPDINIEGMSKIMKKPKKTITVNKNLNSNRYAGSRGEQKASPLLRNNGHKNITQVSDVINEIGDAYIGDGLYRGDMEREIKALVENGYDEDEVRSWYQFYTTGDMY